MLRTFPRPLVCAVLVLFLCALKGVCVATPPGVIELRTEDHVFEGTVIARDRTHTWLMGRDGQLNLVQLNKVRTYKSVSPQFRGYTPGELRDRLLTEFGKEFQIAATRHYLVCSPSRDARQYAELFEDVYRNFHHYFVVRGFEITEPDFPLVAVVLPTREAFTAYCKADGLTAQANLRGYYHPTTNRVALYIPDAKATAQENTYSPGSIHSQWNRQETETRARPILLSKDLPNQGNVFANRSARTIDADFADTMIHEATHQAAFNLGLHPRLGETPKWVVEGLATVFEAPGIREASGSRDQETRINRDRFVWFGNYVKDRHKANSLGMLLKSDAMFRAATLDAYSEAWALSFYLIETRSHQYGRYLKTLANRDPFREYGSEERLSDFQNAFGSRLDLLETEFLRYMKRLQ